MLLKSFPMQIVVQKAPKWCLNCGFECENSYEEFCTDCLEVIYTSFQDNIRYAAKSDPTDGVMWDSFENAMTHVYNDKGSLKPIEIEGPLFASPNVPIFHEIHPYSKQTRSIPHCMREQRKENQKPVLERGSGIYPIVVPTPNGSLAIGNKTVKVFRVRPLIRDLKSEYQSSEETVKRGRGRPRIHPIVPQHDNDCENIDDIVRRGRGRPRIHPVVETKPVENGDIGENVCEQVKRGRGRPRIHPNAPPQGDMELDVEQNPKDLKRRRGRPRKYPKYEDEESDNEDVSECPESGRGRPRKYPRYEEPGSASSECI